MVVKELKLEGEINPVPQAESPDLILEDLREEIVRVVTEVDGVHEWGLVYWFAAKTATWYACVVPEEGKRDMSVIKVELKPGFYASAPGLLAAIRQLLELHNSRLEEKINGLTQLMQRAKTKTK